MSATTGQIVGAILAIAGGYLWFVQRRVLWSVVCLILGALIFVGALHASGGF